MPDIGKIKLKEITEEIKESYLDYAMSVIVARALPDVRDGLKPVHRRILYAMHDMGLTHQAKYKKSANVVGEVLGKYHPHGDTAVYDSMVRMAQSFSLRYPLIDGQGNFGCFTKDTKIKLTDGRDICFDDLVEEHRQGKKNYTYTVNSTGLISIAEIKNPRVTRKNAKIMKVILDNNEEIRCTPNHLFMTRDGSYRAAKDLKSSDSLMPLYQRLSVKIDRLQREGYILIYQNKTGEWIPAHHLADNYNLTNKEYSKKAGRVRHHRDFNKLNNDPDNVTRLQWGEHWRVHHQQATNQHKDPKYREKIAEGRRKFWADPNNRKRNAERIALRNISNWKNPEYREKMRVFLSMVNKEYIKNHPEKRQEFSERASRTLKKLWQNPVYKKLFNEKIVAANKKRISNNTGKVKFLAICREVFGNNKTLSPELYEQWRNKIYRYGRATSWETGINKYYKNDTILLLKELTKNHKVRKIVFLNQKEDVYDLTIDKTHNFSLSAGVFVHNSVDGDSAAAMRYTEARMTLIAGELLKDIEKNTVDFIPNYDGSREEPTVLPGLVPNLLLNGTVGIAVGMATNIPPHNLSEVLDASAHLIDHPDASPADLMDFIYGPDFPTGGLMFNEREIREAYVAGRGAIVTRGVAEIEEGEGTGRPHSAEASRGRRAGHRIIVTEIPYQVNKAEMIEKIAELVRDKKMEGIRDIRDESDKDGLRIVIDLKHDSYPQKVLNNLYKHTDLEKKFHLNMLALVDGIQPEVLSIKGVLQQYLKHRESIITRRTAYDLQKAKDRAHILEGLKKALDHIDSIITTIKKSENREEAHGALIKKFGFSEIQASAILEMKLQSLAGLERQKIEDELKDKKAFIKDLEILLRDRRKILGVIKDELADLKKKYGDPRKTRLVKGAARELADEDLIPEEDTVIVMTKDGSIKRLKPENYRSQKRGGKGTIGMETREEDIVLHLLIANTHADLLFFSNTGKVYQVRAYEIPEGSRTSKGKAIQNFLSLGPDEQVTSILPAGKAAQKSNAFIVMVTKNGVIKKVNIDEFESIRRSGIVAIKLQKNDFLLWARLTTGTDDLILVTKNGQAIRCSEKDVRPMGRAAGGVRAIRLKKGDIVVGMDALTQAETKEYLLLVVTENGFGKKTAVKEYKRQKRGGSGIKTGKITAKNGPIVTAEIISPEKEEIIAISRKGQVIRTELGSISLLSRATQGVRVMKLQEGDKVASVTTF